MKFKRIIQIKHFREIIQICVVALLSLGVFLPFALLQSVQAAGATTSLHIIKYDYDGVTVLNEKTVSYEWMEKNLPVQGDGVVHFYHQGPIFEGDMWDPLETQNLKDKGALMGTALEDLCELVGGMAPRDEVMVCAVDGYRVKFAYTNVYIPPARQGAIVLCWYRGEDIGEDIYNGSGYPGNDAYSSAIQLVFMAKTPNSEGKFVFGNDDMRICLPQEEYQHFYEGLPSTNGLSVKWASEVRVYTGGASGKIEEDDFRPAEYVENHAVPWFPVILGSLGLILVGLSFYFFARRRG